jgi:hypothetical protein
MRLEGIEEKAINIRSYFKTFFIIKRELFPIISE